MGNRGCKHGEEKTKKVVEEKKPTERTSADKVEQDKNAPNNDAKPTEGCACKNCTCNPCTCGKKETKCAKCDLESCDCKVEDSINEVTKEIENLKVKSGTDETDELANKLKDDENEVPSVQPEAVVEIKAL